MTIKIKEWKVNQISRDMSKYGDKYDLTVAGHEAFHNWNEYVDENGFLTVTNILSVEKETEKAMLLNIGGFMAWCPKSAIEM